MRRTVVVDDKLLEEAREALGTNGVRETIEASLREVVRRHRLQQLGASLGAFDLWLTPEELERMRRDEWGE
jgi:Arc/MetJ family transcription regulator